MGQYYTAVVIDENDRISKLWPHNFDNGAKLTEHSWIGNNFVNAVYSMINNRRRKVAWIGDYADDPYEPEEDFYAATMPLTEFMSIYNLAYDDGPKLGEKGFFKKELSCLDYDTKGMYLVNHDRTEYIDIAEYIQNSSVQDKNDDYPWCLSPLPLLTACGNDRGGGDFRNGQVGYDNIGTWAFQWVEYTDKLPEGYTKANYRFMEKAVISA